MATPIDVPQIDFSKYLAVIVGSGLVGLTIAERIVSEFRRPVLIIEKRSHLGGNAYSETNAETGVDKHLYGPHIFHTSNMKVWEYVNRFTSFNNYRHHVWAATQGELFPLPITLATMSQFWGRRLSPSEARQLVARSIVPSNNPKSFEEKALATIGTELYETFFKGYTQKQWQTDPRKLPASVFGRLPIRFSLNTRYFDDRFEGIPTDGYGSWIRSMTESDQIHYALNTSWQDIEARFPAEIPLIYTGPLDAYFMHEFGRLGWRTLDFEFDVIQTADYQGAAQINFPDVAVKFTREVEYKHFQGRIRGPREDKTLISREFPRFASSTDEPYYPINSENDRTLLKKYREKAKSIKNVYFCGRLGTYQYLDMHAAIASALTLYESELRPTLAKN